MDPKQLKLTAFQARDFKTFVDTGWIEIKPLTLIFGHNSSGKSALLSVLPMLQQTIVDPNIRTPFVFSSETGVDLGMFDEVAYQHRVSIDRPIWLNLRLSLKSLENTQFARFIVAPERLQKTMQLLNISGDRVDIEIAASYNKRRRQIAIIDFKILDQQGNLILRTYRKTVAAGDQWYVEPQLLQEEKAEFTWQHFLPRIGLPRSNTIRPYYDLLIAIRSVLQEDLSHIVHIGPLRDAPRRAYRLTGESPKDVGVAGENWLGIFLQARTRKEFTSEINRWLVRLGYTLRIEWGKQGYVHPMLKDTGGLETSLKDNGFGISQVLPVLIQGFSSPPGTILILEQPEIHLHPRAQAELGDMLLAISKRGVRLLVETHSEHLLLRLRRRMAESFIDIKDGPKPVPEDIGVYFIERLQEQGVVHSVSINKVGEFLDAPERFQSFFSDDYEETIQWSQARARIAKETGDASGA
jgi:hypothetical protein